jgi:hypothetical protein
VVTGGIRQGGEHYDVLMFEAPPADAREGEVVGFVITRHKDGYALRAAYDKPKDQEALRIAGNDMCFGVLNMFIDSDIDRAYAYRDEWWRLHPDSTAR